MRTPDQMARDTISNLAAEARGEKKKCPDCGAWMDYADRMAADPQNCVSEWHGGFDCQVCGHIDENEPPSEDDQIDAYLAGEGE